MYKPAPPSKVKTTTQLIASWLPKTKQKPLDAQEGTDDKNRQLSERKEIFITMFVRYGASIEKHLRLDSSTGASKNLTLV